MSRSRFSRESWTALGCGACIFLAAWLSPMAHGSAQGTSTGSLTLSILAPTTLPSGFVLNPGGTIPGNFAFPAAGNAGSGAFTAIGSAGCTPAGCTSPEPGTDLQYQLTTDLDCTAESPGGAYGGLEDSFALFGANNLAGTNVTLELRFMTSWSVSATAGPAESAEASVDLLWAVPTDFCIELTSCPTGLLSGGAAGNCPAGFLTSTTLILGTNTVEAANGEAMGSAPMSTCDATVVVLPGASSGGDLSVTSSCLANAVLFADGFESGTTSAWSSTVGAR